MRPEPLCVLVLCGALGSTAVGAQEDPPGRGRPSESSGREAAVTPAERQRDIRRRIERFAEHPNAEAGAGALEQARQALQTAREASVSGNAGAARRARQIAWAALALASHRISLAQARAELRATRRRLRRACGDAAAEHRALKAARAQRAALQDGAP